MTIPTLLALATLGDTTQIGSYLLVSHHPRWSWQVRQAFSLRFSNKLCLWNYSFILYFNWQSLLAKPSVVLRHDNAHLTCLGNLGDTVQIGSFLLVKVNMASEAGIFMAPFALQLMIIVLKLLPVKGLIVQTPGQY